MGELGLEGEIVEQPARFDPEAAFEVRPLGGIGQALAKGQIDAQASEEWDLPGPEHQCKRALPMALVHEVAQHLSLEVDAVAAKCEVGAWQGNREGGHDDPRKACSNEIGVLGCQLACDGKLWNFEQVSIDPSAALSCHMPASFSPLRPCGYAEQREARALEHTRLGTVAPMSLGTALTEDIMGLMRNKITSDRGRE
jgi:hypothetical protein